MESEAETGRTLRSRLMELLYASNGSTFTLRQLSTILAATESDIQREAESNDFTLFNAREKSVQLKQRFTDRLKPSNRSRNVIDDYEYSDEDYSHNTRDVKHRIVSDDKDDNKNNISKLKKKIVFNNSGNNDDSKNNGNGEFTSEPRQDKRTLFDFTSAARQLSAFGDLDEEEHKAHKQEINGKETSKGYDSVYAKDNRRSRVETRSKIRNTSRRRGAVRSKSRKRAGARDEDRTAIPTGQVGRVGYVCVADEFHLAGLESHYRNLGYFTKFDFDVLHVRFADAEMQRSTSPYTRNENINGDNNLSMNNNYDTYNTAGEDHDEYDPQQHDDEKSWNYGATALNSNRMSPLTKEHAPMPATLYTDKEVMSGRGGAGGRERESGVSSARDRHHNRSASGGGGGNNSSKSREGKRANDKQVSGKDYIHSARIHYDPNTDNNDDDEDDVNINRAYNINKDAAVVTATVDSANDDNGDDDDYERNENERKHKHTSAHQAVYSPYDEMYNSNSTNINVKAKHAMTDRDDFVDQNDYDHDSDLGKEMRTNVNYRGGFDLFIFEYGAVVWWGFDQRYFKIVENDFMLPDSAIAKYVVNRYTTKLVNENYPVWCTYNLLRKERLEADEDFKRRLRFDHFLIPYGQGDVNTSGISMLCASHALAQSAKIDYLEIKVQELTENCSPLPRDLKEKGGVTISERRLLQLRGEVLSYRLMLKSGSDLLDEPDLFWENAYLKPVFQATKEGFEISERVEALDNKLDATNEILSILADEFSQRHGARLEWIVIWLVFVEVIIGVLELIVDSRPWFYKH